MSDGADRESAKGVAGRPQTKVRLKRLWRSLMVVALLFLPLQSVYFAFTYSRDSFFLVALDLVVIICLALLAFTTPFSKGQRLRSLVELLVFCGGFAVAFFLRNAIFEPSRTLYFNIKNNQLDKFASEMEPKVRNLELVEIPSTLIVPKEYDRLVQYASGVRFADGTVILEVESGRARFDRMGFMYFEGNESKVVGYLQKTYEWIDLKRMNDHWYKTAHGFMTSEMLQRLPENQ